MKRLFQTVFLAFVAVSMNAQTKVVESFNYDVPSALVGLDCTGEGWGGPWVVLTGEAGDMNIAEGTTYDGLNVSGNRLGAVLSADAGVTSFRELSETWPDDGSDIWFSYLIDITNPSEVNDSWQGISLAKDDTHLTFFGKNWATDKLGIIASSKGGDNVSAISYKDGPAWIVVLMKMTGDAADEQAFMWINPDPTSEPDTAAVDSKCSIRMNDGFNQVSCHLGMTTGIECYFDEIRLGKQWSDVVATSIATPSVGNTSVYNDKANGLISFNCVSNEPVSIEIFNVEGQLVETLNGAQSTGSLQWNTNNVQKGVYMYKLSAGDVQESGKVVVY
jgi:hypothetical protein